VTCVTAAMASPVYLEPIETRRRAARPRKTAMLRFASLTLAALAFAAFAAPLLAAAARIVG